MDVIFWELYTAETEQEVDNVLKKYHMNNQIDWAPYGNYDSNYSIINNQSSTAEQAIIEKITNSVDAMLMVKCLEKGIDPESEYAPINSKEALEKFYQLKNGETNNFSYGEEKLLSDDIQLIATSKNRQTSKLAKPNFIIFDRGEGQTPKNLPNTILSLIHGNKLKIQFTQGTYNQGGSGALNFCGAKGYCLVISKRNPNIATQFIDKTDETRNDWGWTLIRHEMRKGNKNRMYTYYAPNKKISIIHDKEINLLPLELSPKESKEDLVYNGPCKSYLPYSKAVNYGTAIKLYQYEVKKKGPIISHIKYDLASYIYDTYLPIKFIDCRKNKASNSVIFRGFKRIIEDNAGEEFNEDKLVNRKINFNFKIKQQDVVCTVFCCNPKKDGDLNVSSLVSSKPIKLCLGQQFQGGFSKVNIQNAGLGLIKDYIIIVIEFPNIDLEIKADLFMTDRERLLDKEPKKIIQEQLKAFLSSDKELRKFNDYIYNKVFGQNYESNPLIKETLQKWINDDPKIKNILTGAEFKLKGAFKTNTGSVSIPGIKTQKENNSDNEFETIKTNFIPTYFDPIVRKNKNNQYETSIILGKSKSVAFKTDADIDLFTREIKKGNIDIIIDNYFVNKELYQISNSNGMASINFTKRFFKDEYNNKHMIITLSIEGKEYFKHNILCSIVLSKSNGEIDDNDNHVLGIPPVLFLKKENWREGWNQFTAAEYVPNEGQDIYMINKDNMYLELKRKGLKDITKIRLNEDIFLYSMLFLSMTIKSSYDVNDVVEGSLDLYKTIDLATKEYAKCLFINIDLLNRIINTA